MYDCMDVVRPIHVRVETPAGLTSYVYKSLVT